MGLFQQLLSPDFMPHGFCYLWNPGMVWLHVISDGLIALSYYCIPIILIYFIRKNRDLPFGWVFWMFGIFILACGTTHLMEIWNVWHGNYLLAGVIKAITAAVSVMTAAMLIPLVPKAISLPGRIHGLGREIAERERAEAALKESLATSERALQELADQKFALDQHAIVAVTDVQGTITYVNEKFCAISQYSKDELIGQSHRILNSGHHSTDFFRQMYRSLENGQVWHGEVKNRAKDGSIYWVDTTIVPFAGENGKPRRYVAIRAEITERKRAEEELRESQERFRLLLDGVKDYAIFMLDPEGHVISWNAGAARMKGYRSEEILGKHFSCFYIAEDRNNDKPSRELQASLSVGGFEEQAQRVRKDGSTFWANVVITPMFDGSGNLKGFCEIARDITERKLAEQEVKKLNDELEHRVVELARKVEELARSNAELEQFAYIVSHDLQEPLRMVAAYTQLLGERYRGKLDAEADKFIGYACEGTQRMQSLIQDLLTFSRVGRNSCGRVDCEAAMRAVLLSLAVAIQESGAVVTHGALPVVWANRTQLAQVFQNLIGNAIKFRGQEPPVVSVRAEKDGPQWLFSVSDNGIGIAPEHAENIFVAFQRLHTRTEYAGNGIGLAICKKIVEHGGGKIWVESEAGHGSIFKFTLPCDGPENRATENRPAEKKLRGEEVPVSSV